MALTSTSAVLGLFQRVAALSALHAEAFEHIAALCADADADIKLDPSTVTVAIRCALLAATTIAGVRAAVAPLPLPPSVASPVLTLHATAAAAMQLIVASAARSVLTSASAKPLTSAEGALRANVTSCPGRNTATSSSSPNALEDDDDVLNELATTAAALTSSVCDVGRADAVAARGLFCWWRFLQHRDHRLLNADVSAVLARHHGADGSNHRHPDSADLYSLRALSRLVGDSRCSDEERAAAHADLAVAEAVAQAKAEQAQGWRAAKGTRSKVLALLIGAAFHRDASKRHDLEGADERRQLEAKALAVTKAAASVHAGAKRYAGEPLSGVSQHFTVHRLLVEFAGEMFSSVRMQRDSVVAAHVTVDTEARSPSPPPRGAYGEGSSAFVNLASATASRLRCDAESADDASARFAFEEHLVVPAATLDWLRQRTDGFASPSATGCDGESHSPGGTRRSTIDWDSWEAKMTRMPEPSASGSIAAVSVQPARVGLGEIVRFVGLDRVADALSTLRQPVVAAAPRQQQASVEKPLSEAAPPPRPKHDGPSKRPLSAARPSSARLTRRSSLTKGGTSEFRPPQAGSSSSSSAAATIPSGTTASGSGGAEARKDFATFAPPTVLAASALVLLAARVAADRRECKRVAERRRQERAKAEAEARWERTRSASLRSLVRQHVSSPPAAAADADAGTQLKKAHSCVIRRPQSATGRRLSQPGATPLRTSASATFSAAVVVDDPTAVARGRIRPRSATLNRRPSSAAPVVAAVKPSPCAESKVPGTTPNLPAPPTKLKPETAPVIQATRDGNVADGATDDAMFVRGVYGTKTVSSSS